MPPLQSNPEITHARPGTEEFSLCIDALKAGSLVLTVAANAGNVELEHFFTKAEADDYTVNAQVLAAATADGLLNPPLSVITFLYRTYDDYAEAMDLDTGKPPAIVEGIVESVITSQTEPYAERRRTPRRRSWGRFFGLKGDNDKGNNKE